jgi:hypothetical protein
VFGAQSKNVKIVNLKPGTAKTPFLIQENKITSMQNF